MLRVIMECPDSLACGEVQGLGGGGGGVGSGGFAEERKGGIRSSAL